MSAMEALQELLRSWKGQRVCLAYSGGVDSVFLLDQLKKCGVSVLAVTLDTFLHPKAMRKTPQNGRLCWAPNTGFFR